MFLIQATKLSGGSFRRPLRGPNRRVLIRHWEAIEMDITVFAVVAALFLLSGTANAAPNVFNSELPGRERERFMESPVERLMNAPRNADPLIRWKCRDRQAPRRANRPRFTQDKNC